MFVQEKENNLKAEGVFQKTIERKRHLLYCVGCDIQCSLSYEEVRTIVYPDGVLRSYYPKIGTKVIRDYKNRDCKKVFVFTDEDAMVAVDKAREICNLCDYYKKKTR